MLIGPALDRRAAATRDKPYAAANMTAVLLLVAGVAVIYLSLRLTLGYGSRAHAVLLLLGAAASAFVALMASPAARLRIGWKARREPIAARPLRFALEQILAGIAVAALIAVFSRVLRVVLDDASVDLRHFSLHPWSGARLTLLGGILACHLAALWAATLVFATTLARWRLPRAWRIERIIAILCWTAPAVVLAVVAGVRQWPIPAFGLIASAVGCAVAGGLASRAVAWFRHATVAGRILALFIAFVVPSLLLYPSVNFFTERNLRSVIATRYTVEAQNHYQTLQERLAEARNEIDALPLAEHVRSAAGAGRRTAHRERVFRLETDGARPRTPDVGSGVVQTRVGHS